MTSDRTVFVVMLDGDSAVGDSLKALLDSVGIIVEVYRSRLAFLMAFQPDRHGCLVVDLPPDTSGLEFVDEIVALGIGMPVILLSPTVPAIKENRALPAQVVAVIEKPFMDQPFVDAIESAFAR